MSDLVEEIALFLRQSKAADLDRAIAELPRRWPEATRAQLEAAARSAIAWLQADTRRLRAEADLIALPSAGTA